MAKLHAGTSGWAYPTWKPAFYPPKLPQKAFLNYYGSRLNAVEVNYTFRHTPSEKSQQNWIQETPAGFRFCVKAHQAITHIKRLKDTDEIAKRFIGSLEPLQRAGKLGPVLFQLPPNFKANPELLDDFLGKLPRLRSTFEFRHESWFCDPVFAVLRKHNAALCVAESDELATPETCTADFCYYRLRKAEYSEAERAEISAKTQRHTSAGRDVFVFFKHEDTPEGALYASELVEHAANGKAGVTSTWTPDAKASGL